MAGTAAVIGLVVSAAGTGASVRQSRKAADEAEKAGDIERRQADIENQRRIRQSIEQARIQRAQVLAAGLEQGGQDSSGLLGGLGSAQSQLASNVGFANQVAGANRSVNRRLSASQSAAARGQTFQQIGALPGAFGFDAASSAEILRERFGD